MNWALPQRIPTLKVSCVGQIECKEGVVKRAVVGGGERARRWLGPG